MCGVCVLVFVCHADQMHLHLHVHVHVHVHEHVRSNQIKIRPGNFSQAEISLERPPVESRKSLVSQTFPVLCCVVWRMRCVCVCAVCVSLSLSSSLLSSFSSLVVSPSLLLFPFIVPSSLLSLLSVFSHCWMDAESQKSR